MGRKCSHCGNNGHNSRTCSSYSRMITACGGRVGAGGVRLFGVRLDLDSHLKKSFSMECLCSSPSASSSSSSPSSSLATVDYNSHKLSNGSLSDGLFARTQERKKGVAWTEQEHRNFLAGLEKLGKGDWRGISRNFVITRTSTQVASHAQKYFLRQASLNKKKRRSSLFDVVQSNSTKVHFTELKSNNSLFSCEFPLHSASSHLENSPSIGLNLLGQETESGKQETKNPQSHYGLYSMSIQQTCGSAVSSPVGSVSQPFSSLRKPPFPLEPLNLELTIASPNPLDQTDSSPVAHKCDLTNKHVNDSPGSCRFLIVEGTC